MPEVLSTKKRPKKLPPTAPPKKRNVLEHLQKLRGHLVRALVVALALAVVAFLNRHLIFDTILLAPKSADFLTNVWLCYLGERFDIGELCFNAEALKIVNYSMAGQFLTHLYVSVIAGIVVAFPYIIFETWSYLAYVLKIKSRRTTIATMISGTILFVFGILFSYFLIVPLTVNFLGTYHVSGDVQNHVTLGSYIGTIATLVLGVGVVFELPVFIFFLAKYGTVSPKTLRKQRPIMIVVVVILAAIITPPDVISQILVSIPLLILYEISIGVAAGVYPKG
ncbi:MAG: twin-arginine translocase subunit TatC [Bacteroidales bacterium]